MSDHGTALEQVAHAARRPIALGYVRCSSYRNQHTGLGEETQRRLITSYFELLKPGDHIIFACLDRAFRQIKDLILGREWFEGPATRRCTSGSGRGDCTPAVWPRWGSAGPASAAARTWRWTRGTGPRSPRSST